MQIKTTKPVNAGTLDGRVYTADEGTVTEIDDDDAEMVGLARSLIMSGQAEHYGDAGTVVGVDVGEDKDPEAELDDLSEEDDHAGVDERDES